MKQVKITSENDKTVHAGDVTPQDGIWYRHEGKIWYVLGRDGNLKTVSPFLFDERNDYQITLIELLNEIKEGNGIEAFTLDNRRIVTEKELTVEDITDQMHVGFIDGNGDKGHVVKVASAQFTGVSEKNYSHLINGNMQSQKWVIKELQRIDYIKEVRIYDTRTGPESLYAWLAE